MRILTYDINKELSPKNYDGFCKIIKSYNFIKLSKCSYALDTNEEPLTIFSKLKPYIHSDDCLLILSLNKPFYGQASQDLIDWISKKI